MRKCLDCGASIIHRNSNASLCSSCARKRCDAYQKAYQKTDKYKAYQKAYQKTDRYKAYKKAYQKTDKYKAYQKAYQKTDKYKAYKKAYYQKNRNKILAMKRKKKYGGCKDEDKK